MRAGMRSALFGVALLGALPACAIFPPVDELTAGGDDAGIADLAPPPADLPMATDLAATDLPIKLSYRDTVLADQPIAYWRLSDGDGGVEAHDETGHGNALAYQGDTQDVLGGAIPDGNGCHYFGEGGFAGLGIPLTDSQELTIELWVNANPLAMNVSTILEQGLLDSDGFGLFIAGGPSVFLQTYWSGDGGSGHFSSGGMPVSAMGFTYVVVTIKGDFTTFYADGMFYKQEMLPLPLVPAFHGFRLSVPKDYQPGADSLNGFLDEVAIYPTALDAATISNHYLRGIGK
jgi:hypothetical protein